MRHTSWPTVTIMPDPQLITDIAILLFFSGGIYWAARHEHKRVSLYSDRRCIHGRYIPHWTAIGFLCPGLLGYLQNWPRPTETMGPMALSAFGLFFGLAAGWIHGGIRLALHRTTDQPLGQTSDAVQTSEAIRPEDNNPYRPPRGS